MATTEIERLLVRLVGDATSYQKMLRDAGTSSKRAASVVQAAGLKMQALATRLKSVGASMSRLGRSLSLRLTAPLTIFGGLAVRAFAQFDQAMVESTSIMKVTAAQTERMRDVALELSSKAVQGPKELAESYFFLASAGKSAEQSMSLLPAVAEFATAGAFDMALATDLLTDAQSALGLTSKNVVEDTMNLVRVGDLLVGANTLANASVQQFATALTSKAGAAFKAFNVPLEQGIALLAAFADQGIKAELAGNAADRMLRLLIKSARENAKEFKKFNIQVFDNAGELRTFKQIIGDLENALGGMSTEQKSATLDLLGFEARVQGVILPLLGTSKSLGVYADKLKDMGGITKDVASKQMKSFTNQMKLLKNQITIVGIEIGEILAPIIEKMSDSLKNAIDWWKKLSPEIKKTSVIVALAVAAIGPLLITVGGLVSLLGFAVSGIVALVSAIGALLSPIALATAAVVAFGAWVLWVSGIAETVSEFLSDSFKKVFDDVGKALKAGELKIAMKIMWEGLKEVWFGSLAEINDAMGGWLTTLVQGFLDSFKAIAKGWINLQNFISRDLVSREQKNKARHLADVKETIRTGRVGFGPISRDVGKEELEDFKALRNRLQKEVDSTQPIIDEAVRILEESHQKQLASIDDFFDARKALSSKELRQREADAKAAKSALKKELNEKILAAQIAANAAAAKAASGDKPKLPVVPTIDPNTIPKIPTITAPVRFEVVKGVGVGSAEDLARIAEFQAGAGMRMASTAAPKIAKAIIDDPFRNVPIPGVPDIPLLPSPGFFERKPERPERAMPIVSNEELSRGDSILAILTEIRDDAREKPGFDEVAEAAELE